MNRIRVGVLRGGPSSEYEVSLGTGAAVLQHLPEEKYLPIDVFISRGGTWHVSGIPREPQSILSSTDVIFNALHGEYGEDGTVQRFLENSGVPYTGPRPLAAGVAMNKLLTKRAVSPYGIKTPRHEVLEVTDDLDQKLFDLFRSFPQPSVTKPLDRGSSVGVTIVRDFEGLRAGARKAFEYSPRVLVEEYIKGREATCGVIDDFRDERHYALLPVEIVPAREEGFFSYDAKYKGKSEEICPGRFTKDENDEIQRLAKAVHEIVGLKHYSRSDFIVSPRGIYFLEVNTLPGLTQESLIPRALKAIGSSISEFLDHVISLAMRRL